MTFRRETLKAQLMRVRFIERLRNSLSDQDYCSKITLCSEMFVIDLTLVTCRQ